MEKVGVIEFSAVFKFAEDEYGIDWNRANDVFFNGSLEYGRHTECSPGDWSGYVDLEDIKPQASDYTVEEVGGMSQLDQSYVILEAYFEANNITDDEVLVDCT